ncbi:hypothetical protein X777_02607 [Ooceraea biroi]|uniref:Uncharacterized protein n=1 Tax=Ooceraea biroi TaxID=2015173 RepID=A0A026WNU9_OOCBI|nr:hypothetical protein X777_02607 [Ooceraea biroi]
MKKVSKPPHWEPGLSLHVDSPFEIHRFLNVSSFQVPSPGSQRAQYSITVFVVERVALLR